MTTFNYFDYFLKIYLVAEILFKHEYNFINIVIRIYGV